MSQMKIESIVAKKRDARSRAFSAALLPYFANGFGSLKTSLKGWRKQVDSGRVCEMRLRFFIASGIFLAVHICCPHFVCFCPIFR
jgi:hypothetical protein